MDQIQPAGKVTHLQARRRQAHLLLAGLILAPAETGMKAPSYPTWKSCGRLWLLGQHLEEAGLGPTSLPLESDPSSALLLP